MHKFHENNKMCIKNKPVSDVADGRGLSSGRGFRRFLKAGDSLVVGAILITH